MPDAPSAFGTFTDAFVADELSRLGYGSPEGPTSDPLHDADDLLDAALGETLSDEQSEGLRWAIENFRVDWPYRVAIARHRGHAGQLEKLLAELAARAESGSKTGSAARHDYARVLADLRSLDRSAGSEPPRTD